MGFSLKLFLQEIEVILNSKNMAAEEKLQDIAVRVMDAREYAKVCGMLDD